MMQPIAPKRYSLRTRLTLLFIGLGVIPLLLAGGVLAWQSYTVQQEQALFLQRQLVERATSQIADFIDKLEGELRLVNQAQRLSQLPLEQQRDVLSRVQAQEHIFRELRLLDMQGQEQVRVSRLGEMSAQELGSRAGTAEFSVPMETGETYFSPVWIDEKTGEPVMTIAVPIFDPRTGDPEGVLAADIRFKQVWDFIANISLDEGAYVFLVDDQGRVIAHHNPSVVLRGTTFQVPEQEGVQTGLEGDSVILAVDQLPLGTQTFYVIAEQLVSEALALSRQALIFTGSLLALTLVVATILGFLAVRQIVQPVQALVVAAQEIEAGNLSKRAPVVSNDEIGILASAFNIMAEQLQGTIDELERHIKDLKVVEASLRKSEERYRNIYTRVEDAIYETDFRGNIIGISPSIEKHSGYRPEELIGQRVVDFYADPDEYAALWAEMETTGTVNDFEIRLQKKNGELGVASVTAHIVYDDNGQPIKTEGVLRNITERKRTDAINASRLHLMQFATMHSLDELLEETLNETEKLTNSLIGFCHFVDDDQINLSLQNWSTRTKSGFCQAEGKGLHYPIDQAGVWVDCVYQRKPVVHNDYASLPHRKGMPEGHAEVIRQLVVPLIRGDKVMAILGVGNKPVDYNDKDVEAASLLADMAWEITERKRAEEALQKYTRQLETLNTVTATLSTSLTLDEVLKLILKQIRAVIQIDSAAIFLKEEEGLRVVLDWNIAPSLVGKLFPDDELFNDMSTNWEPVILDHPRQNPHFKNWGSSETIETWLGVPLVARDVLIGFMTLDSNQPKAFSLEQLPLVKSFAAQSAQAVDNARQFGNAQRRMERLTSLHDIDQAISNNLDLHTTLNVLLGHVLHQLRVDAAAILLYQPELQNLEFVAGKGFRTDSLRFTKLRLGQGFAGRVALERNVVQVPDLRQQESLFLHSTEFHTEQFVAYIGVPLIAKGNIIGVLEIYHRQPLDPDPEWMAFLSTLAGQAAIAINNLSLFGDLQKSNLELVQAYDATIEGWAKALELRDMETEGHSRRVVDLTLDLSRKMGISDRELVHVRRGALLHDIGKMGIPDHLLKKTGQLSEDEWVEMRKHPQYAYNLLSPITHLRLALDIPYCHHEKWDGTGYPRGLEGEQIPLPARIFAIVDVWDALLSDRTYREAWPREKVLTYIQDQSGKYFDPKVVDAFIDLIAEKDL